MFDSYQKGTFGVTFANGIRLSVIWKPGSYSDNNALHFGDLDRYKEGHLDMQKFMGLDGEPCLSKTAEVMVSADPTNQMSAFLENYHDGDNPAGYLTVDEVMRLLVFAWGAKPKPKPKPKRLEEKMSKEDRSEAEIKTLVNWNYRLVRVHTPSATSKTHIYLSEAYYDDGADKDKPHSYTKGDLAIMGETVEEAKEVYDMMAEAFKAPVIDTDADGNVI